MGLRKRMTAIRATLAPMPNDPNEMRMVAAVWSALEQMKTGPDMLVSLSVSDHTFLLRSGPTTTAMSALINCYFSSGMDDSFLQQRVWENIIFEFEDDIT